MNNKKEVEKKVLNIINKKERCVIYGNSCIGKSRLCKNILKMNNYHKIDCIRENGRIEDECILKAICLSKSLLENENKKCLFLDEIENVEYSKIVFLVNASMKWKVPLIMTGKRGERVPGNVTKIYMYAKQKGFIEEEGYDKKDVYYGEGVYIAKHILSSLTKREREKERIKDELIEEKNSYLISGFLFDEYPVFTRGNMKKCMKASDLFSATNIFEIYKQKKQMYVFGYYGRTILLHRYIDLLKDRIDTYQLKHYFPKCIYKNKSIHLNKHKLLEINGSISSRIFSLDYLGIEREKVSDKVLLRRNCDIPVVLRDYMEEEGKNKKVIIKKREIKKEKHFCMSILKSGKRKGQECGKVAKNIRDDKWYCLTHK